MVELTNRRQFLAASGTTAIGLGAGFGFTSGTGGAQEDPAEGFERRIQWGGMGSENATQRVRENSDSGSGTSRAVGRRRFRRLS